MRYSIALTLACCLILPAAVAAQASSPEAAYQFATARLLLDEGSFREALDAFAEAVRLAPDEAYIRLEYGRLLARLSRYTRGDTDRSKRAELGFEQAAAAGRLAPDDLDLQAELAQVYLTLAEVDRRALEPARDAYRRVLEARPEDPQILLPLGQIHLQLSENREAVEVLRSAIRSVPGNGTAEWLLARGLQGLAEEMIRDGRSTEAEPLLEEALDLDPGSVEGRARLAELQSRRGDPQAAVETLQGEPEPDTDLRLRLAYNLYLEGKPREGLEVVEALTGAGGEEWQRVLVLRTLLLSVDGRTGAAADVLVAELKDDDAQGEAAPLVAIAAAVAQELERGDHHDMAVDLMQALGDRLRTADEPALVDRVGLELAQLQAAAGDWEAAEELLAARSEAVPARPEGIDLGVVLLYSETLLQLGRGEEALARLAVLEEEGFGPIAAKRAEILYRLGREDEAGSALQAMTDAGDLDALLQAAQVYQRVERYQEAVPLLLQALEADGSLVQARFQLGAAYERLGRRSEAEATFKRLLELDPHFHPALNYLGYMWAEEGENLEEALALVDRAVALDPNNGAYVDSLGWAHFKLGEYERARQLLERAARLEGEDATIYEHLGDAYRAMGEDQKAREQYLRALKLGGENADEVREKLRALGEEGP